MITVAALLTAFYVLLIGIYYIQWLRIPYFHHNKQNTTHLKFSILIPARNESNNIDSCLQSVVLQKYPNHAFEIIVIDDHSTDNTAAKVNAFIHQHPNLNIKLLRMNDDLERRKLKKAAITFGIENAHHPYIILTDADCTRTPFWLDTINQFVQNTNAKMVYAPVLFKASSLFEKIQSLEFAGLVGIGGAAIEMQKPNMCSAANLIFEKNVFTEVDGYAGSEEQATGDDEYLMHKVAQLYPNKVRFLKNRNAIVTTSANQSIAELAQQRRRWVSKSAKYENRFITAILVAAYLFNAGIVLNLLFYPMVGIILLGCKMLIEGLFLFSVLSFFKRKSYILLIPIAEPFHILYVLIIGIWANIGTYTWKGRQVH